MVPFARNGRRRGAAVMYGRPDRRELSLPDQDMQHRQLPTRHRSTVRREVSGVLTAQSAMPMPERVAQRATPDHDAENTTESADAVTTRPAGEGVRSSRCKPYGSDGIGIGTLSVGSSCRMINDGTLMPATATRRIRSHTVSPSMTRNTASPLTRASWLIPGTGTAADAVSRPFSNVNVSPGMRLTRASSPYGSTMRPVIR